MRAYESEGIPIFEGPIDDEEMVSILFRVGRHNEQPFENGLSELAAVFIRANLPAHLADLVSVEMTNIYTRFDIDCSGPQGEEALCGLFRAINEPDYSYITAARKKLLVDGLYWHSSQTVQSARLRYGMVGLALQRTINSLALANATETSLSPWLKRYFNTAHAALAVSGGVSIPAGLRLPSGPGTPLLEFKSAIKDGPIWLEAVFAASPTATISLSFESLPGWSVNDYALIALRRLLSRRMELQGLGEVPVFTETVVTAQVSLLSTDLNVPTTDANDAVNALVDTIEDLVEGRNNDYLKEVISDLSETEADENDEVDFREARFAATFELPDPATTLRLELAMMKAVKPEDVVEAFARLLKTAIIHVPDGVLEGPVRIGRKYEFPIPQPAAGSEYLPSPSAVRGGRFVARLWATEEYVTFCYEAPASNRLATSVKLFRGKIPPYSTIRFASATTIDLGNVIVLGDDNLETLSIDASRWQGGKALLEAIRGAVPIERQMRYEFAEPALAFHVDTSSSLFVREQRD